MQKFNIRTTNGFIEVKGELIENSLSLKMIVHKSNDLNCHNYTVTEFYTGMSLTYGETKQAAIEDALRRERNIEYWEDVNARIEYNNQLVRNNLEKYGYANKD